MNESIVPFETACVFAKAYRLLVGKVEVMWNYNAVSKLDVLN